MTHPVILESPPKAPVGEDPAHISTSAFRVELKKWIDRYLGIALHVLLHAVCVSASPFLPARPVTQIRRIALVKLWGIGNLAMILPYVRAVRSRFPKAEIVFLTLDRNRALVEGCTGVDRVFTVADQGLWRPLLDMLRLIVRLRRQRVDLYLDFEQFLRVTGIWARLGGVRQAIGFDTPHQHRALLYHARVPYRDDRHMSEVFGDIVRSAGVVALHLPPFVVPRRPDAARRARELLAGAGSRPWIVLHPGSGDNFPGRRWPVERFARAACDLHARIGGMMVLTGTKEERAVLEALRQPLQQHGVPVLDLCGVADVCTLVELLSSCDLLISNDTGPVHLASAVGTPVVALYGPNTPFLYGPLGLHSRAIDHRLPCSPCLNNLSGKSSDCRYPACILAIEVDEVVDAAVQVLASVRHASGEVVS